ncbi:hypothetical protein D3C86_1443960 [compost metagenome]
MRVEPQQQTVLIELVAGRSILQSERHLHEAITRQHRNFLRSVSYQFSDSVVAVSLLHHFAIDAWTEITHDSWIHCCFQVISTPHRHSGLNAQHGFSDVRRLEFVQLFNAGVLIHQGSFPTRLTNAQTNGDVRRV